MRYEKLFPVALLLGIVMVPTVANAQFFTSQSSFNTANPGLPVLTFEGIASAGNFVAPAPAFSGVTFTDSADGSSQNVGIASSTFFITPTDVLFLNRFTDPLKLTFAPNVSAVGFNLVAGLGAGSATLTLFNGLTLLDTEIITTASEQSFTTFAGFSNFGNITSLTITPNSRQSVLIDNLAFGRTSSAVPEPGSMAFMAGFGVVSSAFALRRLRRHK